MTSFVSRSSLAVAICSLVLTSSAVAQIKVEVGASVGMYSPVGGFKSASVHSSSLPNSASDLSGASFGAQLRLWVAPRVGFQLAGATSSTEVGNGLFSPGGRTPTTNASISTGSAQLLFLVTPEAGTARVWLGAGGGAIRHGGSTYEPFGTPVNYGAVMSVGSAIRIRGGLSANLGLTSMIYNLDIRGTAATDPGLSERGQQVDLLVHTGLSYSWH
ncbi:MAG: hypothetical protein H0U66_09325 [Gemmatimonadaceae bacterium]|nr:hypothetical protein [Gemmatimonadaceae bacterium]